jgi:hypothetical protein
MGTDASKDRHDVPILLVISFLVFLIAALEIPWYFFVVLVAWYNLGDPKPDPVQAGWIAAIAALPVAIGAILGISVIVRLIIKPHAIRPRTRVIAMIVASLGVAACCAEVSLIIHIVMTSL